MSRLPTSQANAISSTINDPLLLSITGSPNGQAGPVGKTPIVASTHAIMNGRIGKRRVLERVSIQVGACFATTEASSVACTSNRHHQCFVCS